ncbi:MAG: adenylate/guanylate cyclase domain-containing protein, partial [Gammaproteobacteria bacterium]|nr:adenylate/guanylate cyclase domain-containing protein [Gammaproteobacteria bacterium]
MSERWNNPFSLLALFTILLLLLDLTLLGLFKNFDYRLNDWLLHAVAEKRVPANEVVIIDIDEKSLEQLAATHGRYPWPRSVHAELIEGIERQNPKAILFDIIFADPDQLHQEDDAYLSEVAGQYQNLFFPYVRLPLSEQGEGIDLDLYGERLGFSEVAQNIEADQTALLLPYLSMVLNGRLGAINFIEDSDGVGRRYPLYLSEGDWRLPSIVTKVAKQLGYSIPEQESLMLNWQGPVLSYQRLSYSKIYNDFSREVAQRKQDEFTDKVVIIGSTATGMHDLRVTPMGSLHPAIEIIATAIDNLREGDYLTETHPVIPVVITLLSIAAVWFLFITGSTPLLVGAMTLLWTLVLIMVEYLSLGQQLLIPIVTSLIFIWFYYALAALYAFRTERQAREQSIQIFSRFLDSRVVDELISSGESALNMKSESRQITVLFSDIRGFTTMSEKHTAEEIVDILNRYFSRQVQVIFQHSGTVDKFIGDAIMAFWGAPVADDNQA